MFLVVSNYISSKILLTILILGKRAWKNDETSRTSSNITFRTHRLNELKKDITSLTQKYKYTTVEDNKTSNTLIYWMLTRFLYISGGGTTNNMKKFKCDDIRMQILITLWVSYGLAELVGRNKDATATNEKENTNRGSLITIDKLSSKDTKSIHQSISSFLPKETKNQFFTNEFFHNGYLNYSTMFHIPNTTTQDRKVHLELGAGSGNDYLYKYINDSISKMLTQGFCK